MSRGGPTFTVSREVYTLGELLALDNLQAIPLVSEGFLNPVRPEFIIVIFIHYKPRIAVAILDL